MRISESQKQAIVECFIEAFGAGELYLFGSRTDDVARGGDIDLFIDPVTKDNLLQKKIKMLASLKHRIGDQRIDVVVKRDDIQPIYEIAQSTGELLCKKMH